jgi:hypothetical protein
MKVLITNSRNHNSALSVKRHLLQDPHRRFRDRRQNGCASALRRIRPISVGALIAILWCLAFPSQKLQVCERMARSFGAGQVEGRSCEPQHLICIRVSIKQLSCIIKRVSQYGDQIGIKTEIGRARAWGGNAKDVAETPLAPVCRQTGSVRK